MTMRLIYLAPIVATLMMASCGTEPPAADAKRDSILFSAAASTKDMLEALVAKFDAEAEIKINLGPSNGLATQIIAGAPADLFLSASPLWVDEIEKANEAADSVRLLTNRLVLIVPKGNPASVHDPQDLLLPDVKKIALAGEEVPAGKYANQALSKLKLLKQLSDEGKIARGQDVRTALSYVDRGEAEAGIVYSTDVLVAKGVDTVYEFDPNTHDEIVYVLVLLKHGNESQAARSFYEYLQSPAADEVYSRFGFSRIASK